MKMEKSMDSIFHVNEVALLIVMGQSNAHGHNTELNKEDCDFEFHNVYGLSREKNQSYTITEVVWSMFKSYGMNLGETQDKTSCLANNFAIKWQKEINEGKPLPDLYIIQISVGSQGIDEFERDGNTMWWKDRPLHIEPGKHKEVDISLYPLAIHILANAMDSLRKKEYIPRIIGLHWNQWESEVYSGEVVVRRALKNYENIFSGFYKAIGCKCPTFLYQPLSTIYNNKKEQNNLSNVFEQLVETYNNMQIIDLRCSPLWKWDRPDHGIFQSDLVHYNSNAQKWFASYQYMQVFKEHCLVLGDSVCADGRYINYLNTYLNTYVPHNRLTFVNGGLRSETVSGTSETRHPGRRPCVQDRLSTILKTDATHVFLCYGMNDGIYRPFDESIFLLFQKGLKKVVKRIEECGKKVVFMTPPIFDKDTFKGELQKKDGFDFSYLEPYEDYDDVLDTFAQWIVSEFGSKGYLVIDIHRKMKEAKRIRECKKLSSDGDGIHPGDDGHKLIMQSILSEFCGINTNWTIRNPESTWCGYNVDNFVWKGFEVSVAKPNINSNKEWIYRTEFFKEYAQVDLHMLSLGYHVATIRLSNRYGDIIAISNMEKFRQMLVQRYMLREKPIMFAFSRGGLYALHYAREFAENIKKIYFDAPVVDVYSWPANIDNGNSKEWNDCKRLWKLTDNQMIYRKEMRRAIHNLIKYRIPIIMVYGDADDIVPYEENGMHIIHEYSSTTVPYKVVKKIGVGHHPHSLDSPEEIINFLLLT